MLNVINGNVPVNKQLLKKSRRFVSAVFIKGNKSEEKSTYLGEKIRTYQGHRILVLSLLRGQIMHADYFVLVLIPKRMFTSKNTTKEETFDNPIYQQKANQVSLLQRSNPKFDQSSGKKLQAVDTSTDRLITRTRSIGDETCDPDDVNIESFVIDDSEIESAAKKRKDSAYDSIIELKLFS